HGKSPVVGIEAELPLPTVDDPFRADDGPCMVDRDPSSVAALRSPPARASARGRPAPSPAAGLTLRLRDMDLADVFYVLHLLTGQGFVVDEDVRGRINVDLTQVGLDDALAQLARQGVAVSPPGPLRRVSRGATAVAVPSTSGEGTAVTFALKRAPLADVVAVMADADASLPPLPRPASRRLSLWARQARLSAIRPAAA